MRVLRAIVQAFVLAMFNLKAHLRPRRSVGAELVRDHDAGRDDRRFPKPLHEPLRRAGVSSTLDQDVENDAVLIDGAPEPVWLAGDRDDDLIHMPFVAASRRALADLIGECLAELLPPLAHGLVGHANPARRQHFFDHAKAQGKPEIEPNRMADDLRRKAMALVERVAGCRHGGRIAARSRFNRQPDGALTAASTPSLISRCCNSRNSAGLFTAASACIAAVRFLAFLVANS